MEAALISAEQFERDKVCYEQNCKQMRSLNQIMWQVPIIAMTLTGGLWYAVGTVKGVNDISRGVLLAYSGLANLGLVLMINRVRDVITHHLEKMNAFNPTAYVDAKPAHGGYFFLGDRGVCKTFSLLMGAAAAINVIAALLIWFGQWTPIDP